MLWRYRKFLPVGVVLVDAVAVGSRRLHDRFVLEEEAGLTERRLDRGLDAVILGELLQRRRQIDNGVKTIENRIGVERLTCSGAQTVAAKNGGVSEESVELLPHFIDLPASEHAWQMNVAVARVLGG